MGAAAQRNLLANNIYQFLQNPKNKHIKNGFLNQYHNNIIISYFDIDDIIHPQRFQILDHLYSKIQINGSIIHQSDHIHYCKKSNYLQLDEVAKEHMEYEEYFNHLASISWQNLNSTKNNEEGLFPCDCITKYNGDRLACR